MTSPRQHPPKLGQNWGRDDLKNNQNKINPALMIGGRFLTVKTGGPHSLLNQS
jgi:hypothetical protein